MTDISFGSLRVWLRLAWLLPVVWVLGDGLRGSAGIVMPIYIFLAFALFQVGAWAIVQGRISSKWPTLSRPWSIASIMAVVAALVVVAGDRLTGSHTAIGTMVLNWVLLICVAAFALHLLGQVIEYDAVLGDFRFGVLGIVIVLALAYGPAHVHATFTPAAYAGVITYALIGIFALAFARRFAVDQLDGDQRSLGVDSGWIASIAILIGGIAALVLVLAQLLSFDFVGLVGNLSEPILNSASQILTLVGSLITAVFGWVGHLFGFQFSLPRPVPPHLRPGLHGNPRPVRFKRSTARLPAIFITLLKVLGLLVVSAAALGLVALGIRHTGFRHPTRISGERRTSVWSWRKMTEWILRHGREDLGSLIAEHRVHLPRRRRFQSVRDVYRSFLHVGRTRGRARLTGETGLEYSAELASRWHGSAEPLADLNALYMAERYGAREPTAELIQRAKADLSQIERVAATANER